MENCTYIIYLHLYGKRCQLIVLAKRSPIMSKSFWCALVKRFSEYLASEKFSTARIHFSITKTDDFYLTEGWATLHYTEKSFVSTSVNVNNVSTDLRSLRDYCPHTSFNRVNSKNRSCVLVTPFKFICSTIKNGGRRVWH